MVLIKFLDVLLITTVIYLPMFIGKHQKNEESLFWSSLISLILTVISLFLIGNSGIRASNLAVVPISISSLLGLCVYSLYRINYSFERKIFSPLTWIVVLPFVDTMILRRFGMVNLFWMNKTHQLLAWFVPSNVIVLAILAGIVYFFIFYRNRLFIAFWEASISFTLALIVGYIYVHYGLVNSLFAQASFNLWRIVLAKSSK